MMHEKIRPHHLERKAILYVRQSSAHQVLHNRESSALQYAMRDRLTALGWSRIETIDDDLGRSAAGGAARQYPRCSALPADQGHAHGTRAAPAARCQAQELVEDQRDRFLHAAISIFLEPIARLHEANRGADDKFTRRAFS